MASVTRGLGGRRTAEGVAALVQAKKACLVQGDGERGMLRCQRTFAHVLSRHGDPERTEWAVQFMAHADRTEEALHDVAVAHAALERLARAESAADAWRSNRAMEGLLQRQKRASDAVRRLLRWGDGAFGLKNFRTSKEETLAKFSRELDPLDVVLYEELK